MPPSDLARCAPFLPSFFSMTTIIRELEISYSRSSGPGGQNVNKVNSKVEIRLHLETATWIPAVGRERLKTQWGHLVNRRGQLVLNCDEQRSQLANTRICLDRLRSLVTEACRPPPSGPDEATQHLHEKRRARASARRVEEKRARSQWRRFKEPSRIL
ncbi:large ribosomal subunit protein mL62-like isoform X5 [Dermacentor andersoni]|uniref:large ribosomal subunit protein mL62-like isoform X5 n=1 Tax=Dermacentor andersoni TaxID=34620 RepID=UPI0024179BD9|nr:peptidyl-tRNA hydrolase ICT1, mitochondrial-like isoform X2 [Dermacentor andersoni]